MKANMTLNRYLAKTYLLNTAAMLFGLLAFIYLLDTIELIRRTGKEDGIPLSLVLQMGLLKLPEVGQILFPFALLFSAMLTFWQLNRRSELVVLRASGFSAWQFLSPLALLACAIGILQITAINPLGAVLIGKYEQLENHYLKKQDNEIALFKEGLWLRQTTHQSQKNYVILHARKIEQAGWTLKDITVFFFEQEDTFLMRLDAQKATLEKGHWLFKNVRIQKQNGEIETKKSFSLPTDLTIEEIENSFSSPESMSFWQLPSHIQTLEETGFDANRLRVHYHNLLAQPLFLLAMILLAATISIRPARSNSTLPLLISGLFIGFIVFFLSSYLQALGYSGQIPPILAAWSPAIICTLLGISTLISLEDG